MASIRTLHESGDRHFKAFMQVQYLHGKEWFRERQLSLLASWIMVQELMQGGGKSIPTAWLEAIDKLEMAAFVSGYELGSLLKKGN